MFKKALLHSAVVAVAAAGSFHVDPSTRTLRDSTNRQVLFHGVNVVYKQKPYIPDTDDYNIEDSLNDRDIQNLKSWGMNFVRLGVIWEAVETSPGVYDTAYLKKINKLITHLGDNGIYTLVDAHQDVVARITCGEGVPDFYAKQITAKYDYCLGPTTDYLFKSLIGCKSMKEYQYKLDENQDPILSDCAKTTFVDYYKTSEVQSVFRALFDNQLGMQDKYLDYWSQVA